MYTEESVSQPIGHVLEFGMSFGFLKFSPMVKLQDSGPGSWVSLSQTISVHHMIQSSQFICHPSMASATLGHVPIILA